MSALEGDRLNKDASVFSKLESQFTRILYLDGEKIAYLVIFLLAVLSRFWDLGVRVMSHDESLHTRYSWNLYRGDGFSHSPLMHGPLLFHAVALSYLLFGDSDFSARIYTAALGVVIVMLPVLMKKWLGKIGALTASGLFLISPLMLYYSRYIRHDIPAIFAALIMAIMAWKYIEGRDFRLLVVFALAQSFLYASKEVSFIYIAVFGSFLTLYFIWRLFEVKWERPRIRLIFGLAVIALLISGMVFATIQALEAQAEQRTLIDEETADETITPVDPETDVALLEPEGMLSSLSKPAIAALALAVASLGVMGVSVVIGQWKNLRRFPELDVAVTMGSLILPMLSPFLIHWAGFDPRDSSVQGIQRGIVYTAPLLVIAALAGLAQFMKPPQSRYFPAEISGDEEADPDNETLVEVKPDALDWITSLMSSMWWAIAAAFWLFFLFFFTTMFTNGNGIGTGVVGSLGYWLEQQAVERGGQPWYYYLLIMVPMYEFLPAILTLVAGGIGLVTWIRSPFINKASDAEDDSPLLPALVEPDAQINFPVLIFLGYWTVLNFIAYSVAGEKMPWLTTHLTTPMILVAGWVINRTVSRVDWQSLRQNNGWIMLVLLPLAIVALLRLIAPACSLWLANPVCNTIIPESYKVSILFGRTLEDLSYTGVWLAALIVFLGSTAGIIKVAYGTTRLADAARFVGLFFVAWMAYLTMRSSWMASYINYDYANEYLVYAHSNHAVRDVLDQIEEISYKTTNGLALRVAYDNRVSWPMSWYMRDYTNAVYFGEQPSRGLIGDAPVIMAGASNWSKVESITGDRYYSFEYIRMVWPMQDYFGYEKPDQLRQVVSDILSDPHLQRGLWEIFYNRNYEVYADAVMDYRNGVRPNFDLSTWPVPDRMRLYIRKDVYAQIWDYGIAAGDIADAVDPYAAGERTLQPDLSFGAGLLNRPHGMALGPDGNIYVADSYNHQIVVFAPDGTYLKAIGGGFGLAPAENVLNEPWDVAVSADGTVFVADTWNHRIAAYSSSGEFLTTWGHEGAGIADDNFAMWGPRGVAADSSGRVYVSDTGNKRLLVYESDGTFVQQIGSGGGFEGQVDEPVGLALGPDDTLAVVDTWNQRVEVFATTGRYIRMWYVEAWFAQSNERPYIATDSAGNIYITDPDASRIIVFDSFGQYQYSFGDFSSIGIAGAILVNEEAGYMYVSDTAAGQILRFALPADNQ